jgi:hypothetical protein
MPNKNKIIIMKLFTVSVILILTITLYQGCTGRKGSESKQGTDKEISSVPDTGFTGIKQYKSGGHIAMETNFKNGVKDGLSKTFYANGKIRGTTWYKNGLREDSSKWFYEDGHLFRSTPFRRDTVDGIQVQYYRNGKIKARIGYEKGLRTFDFSEYDLNGRKYEGYPELVVATKDNYNSNGTYDITLSLSDESTKVKYYRGDFSKETFDSTKCEKINTVKGKGLLELKKTGTPQEAFVDILASILSPYGNSYLVHKKINLPYKDLK